MAADSIIHNAKIATNGVPAFVEALAIKDGKIADAGPNDEVLRQRGAGTTVINANGRTVIPGLNDSHLHIIRAGLNYNLELRWDGVPSLAEAKRMLREQAQRTPPPQWVRVVGGWAAFQFAERRLPTLDELNAAAPDTPVFVLHLYDRALLNRAALQAVGYTKDTPDPVGAEIQRDKAGNPTGVLIAKPNANILYATLAKGPRLSREDQINSTRHFMRELNRLGVTSAIDAGGGFQNYPDDYSVIAQLHKAGELSVRIAYNLFTQRPKHETDDFAKWVGITRPGDGDEFYRMNGAGEMLVFSAADFEDFLQPRPEMPPTMEPELADVVTILARNRWPFRMHATYDETIARALDVFERVNRENPIGELRWFFDHAETVSDRNIERIRALGGGIAIQHRMAYQGESFIDRYGAEAAKRTPPIRRMLEMGVPVGAGTDATRVASYNPFVALHWLSTGSTVGGTALYPEKNRLSREEALKLYTKGSSWFSREDGVKGSLTPGQLADLAVLSADYFSVADDDIKRLESVLTIVGGRPVYGAAEFAALAPPPPPASPSWAPGTKFGGYSRSSSAVRQSTPATSVHMVEPRGRTIDSLRRPWYLGCDCFAF